MGINNFHKWLKKTYFMSIKQMTSEPYDHVYIDLNYIMHRLVTYISSDDELIAKVISAIDFIMKHNEPLKSINLVADGSANFAKILTQKIRRTQVASDEKIGQKINSLHLTAGTSFMTKMTERIKEYSKKIKENYKNIEVNLNLSDNPDEAEFKICRLLQSNTTNIYDTHLICSNDADMVLIAMALPNVHGINIVFHKKINDEYIISIDNLTEQHYQKFGYAKTKIYDFVFVSLLNGNDYFPKLKFASFDKLWKVYQKILGKYESIVQANNSVSIENLIRFLNGFSGLLSPKNRNITLKDSINNTTSDYLDGIQWCMSLYMSGNYSNYDYVYSGKSIHPMVLSLYLNTHSVQDLPLLNHVMSNDDKIQTNIYPLLVLPYSAKSLIPKKYHALMDNELKYIYDEEMCETCKKYKQLYHNELLNLEKSDSTSDTDDTEDISEITEKIILHKKTHDIINAKEYIYKMLDIVKKYDATHE